MVNRRGIDTMKRKNSRAMWRAAACAVVFASGMAASYAQTAPADGPPANPAITDTHVSGSWSVRCYKGATAACDMVQASFTRDKKMRVASIIIGFIPSSNQIIGRFIVPLGVSFAPGLTLEIGSYRAGNLKYRRCERDGCYVEGILPQPLLEAMQSSGDGKAVMDVVSVDGRKFQLPIVLGGFSDGLAQLKEWTVDKTSAGERSGKD